MKKSSLATFIVGLVLIVVSLVFFILGVCEGLVTKTSYKVVGHLAYTYSTSGDISKGIFEVVLGGFLLNGGILLLILATLLKPRCSHHHGHHCKCEKHEESIEETTVENAEYEVIKEEPVEESEI